MWFIIKIIGRNLIIKNWYANNDYGVMEAKIITKCIEWGLLQCASVWEKCFFSDDVGYTAFHRHQISVQPSRFIRELEFNTNLKLNQRSLISPSLSFSHFYKRKTCMTFIHSCVRCTLEAVWIFKTSENGTENFYMVSPKCSTKKKVEDR